MPPSSLNKNNAAVKRIMQEARELANDPCTDYSAAPLEDDIFEWHCTLRGPAGTEFEGGLYHFRILLPAEYPFRPPSLMMLTPNGRFELNTKICISFTSYHEELWQPAWGVRTAILGLQGFFPLKGQNAVGVGSIEYPANERKRLANLSRTWTCPHCEQPNLELLPDPEDAGDASANPIPTPPEAVSSAEPPQPIPNAEISIEPSSNTPPPPQPSSPSLLPAPDVGHVAAAATINTMTALETHSMNTGAPPNSTSNEASHAMASQPISSLRRSQRPPIILDTAICVLLGLVFAMICRRMV
ncbi:ubiquitin-conjugating enzyme/RWD-like protein [Infundibulicybe gibba]|nr:ubiquitin-conjugating enzyme/RWD-like protein [Infundibulicybe gibba]